MIHRPLITVAPNGARASKADHPALPITIAETACAARQCKIAGADALHLHVRDGVGGHSLDSGLYREALAEVAQQAPELSVQVTTEAAGLYDVADQLHLLKELRPAAASVAVREMARVPELARQAYWVALDAGTEVQHILYGDTCLQTLVRSFDDETIPPCQRETILVFGAYHPPRPGCADDVARRLAAARAHGLRPTVCAFGPQEQACLLEAACEGANLRVGFENNWFAPDGTVFRDNAASVASLCAALDARLEMKQVG